MGRNLALVSIIIPCRNEEKYIGKCLDSLILQDYSKKKTEITVVDGMSEDKTRKIVERYIKKYSYIKLLDNLKKITPCALNKGIKNTKGEIIVRIDAHAFYKKDYISKCVEYLNRYKADNVGGLLKILPSENKPMDKSIALSISNPFGVGNAYYKSGYSGRPKWVDTVFGGCYKREVFQKVGLFNENLVRSQDMEFNLRLKRAGGKILLVPDIVSYYYPKSTLKDFFLHNLEDGVWAIYPLKFVKMPLKLRHYLPLIFILSFIGTGIFGIFFQPFLWSFLLIIVAYFLANFYFSAKIAIKEKNIRFLFLMPVTFTARHIGYGLGSLFGLIKLLKGNGTKKTKRD